MKPLIKLLPVVLLLLAVTFSGCEQNGIVLVDTVKVDQGYLSESYNDTSIVIKTPQELEHIASTYGLQKLQQANIDFSKYMLLAVFEVKNMTTTVDITKVEESQSNLNVSYKNLQRGISNDVSTVYHVVQVPKSDKPVLFTKIDN